MSIFNQGTTESWLVLVIAVMAGLGPVLVYAGMIWGRMQAHDEVVRAVQEDVSPEMLDRLMKAHAKGRSIPWLDELDGNNIEF